MICLYGVWGVRVDRTYSENPARRQLVREKPQEKDAQSTAEILRSLRKLVYKEEEEWDGLP